MTSGPGTVVLYRGHSDYESVGTMVRDLAAAFARSGLNPVLLDLRAPDCVAQAVRLARGGDVRFFLSLNGYGIPAPGQGAGFYAETATPVLVYFVDHPAYHHKTIRAALPHFAVSFATVSEVLFCRHAVRRDIPVSHLPHAAEPLEEAPLAWETRDLPLLLSASLHGEPEALRARWRDHGATVEQALNNIVAEYDLSPRVPLDETMTRVLGRDDLPIEVLASFFATADIFIRSRARRDLVLALSDLPLTVCGRGWEGIAALCAAQDKRARFLPAQDAPAAMAMMRRAKLVLNPMPPYYDSHERPFQAMAAGAVAVVGPGNLFDAPPFEDAVLTMPVEPRAAADIISAALADETRLPAIACAGMRLQKAAHTWDHRAATLLDLAPSLASR
ncbi:MAG TPA: glycosyltransferase [Stellaceae bacterium]